MASELQTKREVMVARALSLVGCGYVYGATGWICTPGRLAQQARQYPLYAPLMARYGPRWMGKRCFDCAQFTREVASAAGFSLPSGTSSQWRAAGAWKEKGRIAGLPDEPGIFLFTMTGSTMTHAGFSIGGGEEIDARGHAYGVVRRRIADTSFTHWTRLAIDDGAAADAPNPPIKLPTRRTLRRGLSGEDVRALQLRLAGLGSEIGSSGADGVFGRATRSAVIRFQRDQALAADGVVGATTWAALALTR